MRLLYFNVQFFDLDGENRPFRGHKYFELNLSATDNYSFDAATGTLTSTRRQNPLPTDFWANPRPESFGKEDTNIYNINIITGENGAGKSTVMQYLLDLLDALNDVCNGVESSAKQRSRFDLWKNQNMLLFEKQNDDKNHSFVLFEYVPEKLKEKYPLQEDVFIDNQGRALSSSIEYVSIAGREQLHLLQSEAGATLRELLHCTKIIYINNTLTQKDYEKHQGQDPNSRRRTSFIYDCSSGAVLSQGLNQYFSYEVFKQVEYVFDRQQNELRHKLEPEIIELRMPRALQLKLRLQKFSHFTTKSMFPSCWSLLEAAPKTGKGNVDNIELAIKLGMLCVAAFNENLENITQDALPVPTQKSYQGTNTKGPKSELVSIIDGTAEAYFLKKSLILSGTNHGPLLLWDPTSGQCMQKLYGHTDEITCLFGVRDNIIVSGSLDQSIRIWDLETRKCKQTIDGHKLGITCTFAISDNCIVTGSKDGHLHIWNLDNGHLLKDLEGHTDWVNCATFLSNNYIVSGSNDHTLRVWNPDTGKSEKTLVGHLGPIYCIAALPDGRVVSGSDDNTLRIWDPSTGRCLRVLEGHESYVTCVDILPDGNIITGSMDGTVRIWAPNTGHCLKTYSEMANCLTVLPDGNVVIGSNDKRLRLFDPKTGKSYTEMESGEGAIVSLSVAREAGADKTVSELRENCLRFINFLFDHKKLLGRDFRKVDDATFELSFKEKVKNSKSYEELADFFEKYRCTCEPSYTIDFSWGLSSGEENMLRFFSGLYHIFETDRNSLLNEEHIIYTEINKKTRANCNSLLLFMDEADLTFHPDWQRRFVHVLTSFLPTIYPSKSIRDIQILLTTHSPLLLGDIPLENISYLWSPEVRNEEDVESLEPQEETFGQNIHTILKSSFFLENGTIGEFAARKINGLSRSLHSILAEQTGPEQIINGTEKPNLSELRKQISIVAPGVLRAKLEQLYFNAETRSNQTIQSVYDAVRQLSEEEMNKLLNVLQKKGGST